MFSLFAFSACSQDDSYTVTFYLYRGADQIEVKVEPGEKVSAPEQDPERENYIFNGWCSDKRGKTPFNFEETAINGDTIIYAAWKNANVTLMYDYNYKGSVATEVEIPVDTKAAQPADPVRERYEFIGWYTDSACTEAFDFNTVLDEDMFLYAGWKQLSAAVTFDLGYTGGEEPTTQLLDLTADGVKALKPADPVRGEEGDYRFEGWYVGSGKKEKEYNFDDEVTGDVALHAKWTKLRAEVTFNGNYTGANNQTTKVTLGEKLEETPAFSRTGYTFDRWYFDAACTIAYDFTANTIDSDMTVYAGWNADPLTVTFDYNYEGSPSPVVVNTHYDELVKEIADPERTGDTFLGWYIDADQKTEFIFGEAQTTNLTLYAGWESKETNTPVLPDNPDDGFDATTKNENGNWEITYYLNDGTNGIYEYLGNAVEEVGNAKYASMNSNGVSYPTREGYRAVGWYTEAACENEFDFSKTRIRQNYRLYAKWAKEWIFEAEYTQFEGIGENKDDKQGYGESSNPKGTNLIEWDQYNAGASNGYYVDYLYHDGSYLEFHINAAEDTDNVVLVLRATVNLYDMFFHSGTSTGDKDGYGIYVNGERYSFDYDMVGAIAPPPDGNGYNEKRAFEDYDISLHVSLKKGENVIRLVTENSRVFYGTMAASAPMIDCIKLYTDTELTWTEGENYKEYNEDKIKDRWDGDPLE
jgi:uncharacterized repeat protein (TIGR02543 family)